MTFLPYVLLFVGFVLLVKGADFFVEGASSIAKKLGIPSLIVGLTLVAMGTSAPEASVSIAAALGGNSDIALGNIVGSNIFNFLVVIGLSAMICPVVSHEDILRRDMWWNLGITAVLFALIMDGEISRIDGVLLLAGMVAYLFIIVKSAVRNSKKEEKKDENEFPLPKAILLVAIGLAGVIWGGNMVVENASVIAASLGLSETLIGLTIVAVGTSFPELVTSIAAARKGEVGIALGNAVGSNIFNVLFILGASSVLTPIHVGAELFIDTAILIGVGILVFVFAYTKKKTTRLEGAVGVILYLAYTAYIIMR